MIFFLRVVYLSYYYFSKTFCLDENLAVRPSWKLSFAGASFWVIPVRPIPFFVASGHSFRLFSFLAGFFVDYDLRDHNYGLGVIIFASGAIISSFQSHNFSIRIVIFGILKESFGNTVLIYLTYCLNVYSP